MNLDIGDTRLIIDECKAYGCLRNQTAYILATAFWESARTMKPIREMGGEAYLKKKRYYPHVGMGYTQVTWLENYKKVRDRTGVDVVNFPSKLLEPDVAVVALVAGAMEGWWTGKKIPDYITLQKSDFHNARRVINGRDKASEIARIAKDYDEALKAEGYGVTDVRPIPQPKGKPSIHKPLTESKELIGGITGLIAAISAFFEKVDVNIVVLVLAALALGFIANRLWARWKGER
jgi:hypothetical protein